MSSNRILLINVVGLTPRGLGENTPRLSRLAGEGSQLSLTPPCPAVTCTSQATMTTGAMPKDHGVVSNGWLFRELAEVKFWQRSDNLVSGEKIWEAAKARDENFRCANLFWRYNTHSACDIAVTERPTYWADGRKGPDIYTFPSGLRDELVGRFGEFPLFRFWGPLTDISSTRWIVDAAMHVIDDAACDLVLAYLPHLDYDVQKFGPGSPQSDAAHQEVDAEAGRLIDHAVSKGYDVAVVSEYGIAPATLPVYLNRALRQAGYVHVQNAQNGELLEPGACRAFAVCSHQVAHVYVAKSADVAPVKRLLEETEGVDQVLDENAKASAGLNHSRSGELVAVAAPDAWFAYPYWLDDRCAPDFARCVAIHDKPGHDPAEMFLGPGGKRHVLWRVAQKTLKLRAPFDVISLDATLVRGSHGRLPDDPQDGPVLLTSWPQSGTSPMPMQSLKGLLLDRLFS